MIRVSSAWWTDCASGPRGNYWAYCTGTSIGDCREILVVLNGQQEIFRTTAPSTPRYLRLAVSEMEDLTFCGQAQDGSGLLLYRKGVWEAPCPCYAVPAIRWEGVSTVAYTQVSATHYVVVREGMVSDPMLIPIGVTSAGISQVFDDGAIMWAQNARQRTIRGTTLLVTMEVEGVVSGQLGGIIGGIPVDVGEPFVALDAPGMDPRLAYSPVVDKYACCSWTTANEACYQELPPFPPVPTEPIRIPDVPVLNHRIATVPFKDPQGVTASASEVVVNGALPVRGNDRPRWCAADPASMIAFRDGIDPGIYAETFDGSDLQRVIDVAAAIRTRVAFCHDRTDLDFGLMRLLRPYDQVWLECYRTTTETLDQSVTRWSQNLDTLLNVWPGQIGLIPMWYGQGGAPPNEVWTVQEILDACGPVPGLANRSSRIVVLAPFAYQRANGAEAHPELVVWWNQVLAQTPGYPIFTPVGPIPPVPVYSSAGAILMADVNGVLNYFGTKDLGSGHVALYADKDHATVWSAHGDTRPADQIGGWETWKLAGQLATARTDAVYWNYVAQDVTGL